MSNYPAGVTDAHPHFNPPTCGHCGCECTPGEDCPDCKEYVKTPEDWQDEADDMAFERYRQEGY